MSCDHLQKPYKQRFKGVETFLRRVAFNLGNTASQTEVKIISCIPIDVTDLQQKIINLERQLHEAQQKAVTVDENVAEKPKDKPSAVVKTALYGSAFSKQSSTVSYCNNNAIDKIRSGQVGSFCGGCSSKVKKSNVSFVFPGLSAADTEPISNFKQKYSESAAAIQRCKNMFRKRKRKKDYKGNNKMKTHLVYYAHQTADNPFVLNNAPLKYNKILSSNDECLSHINNVIRRQYDPDEVVQEFSDTSNFSRPVCRELEENKELINSCESMCSCCHGKFQNIDNYMSKTDYKAILTNLHNSFNNTKVYYDSNHYDVIPVKENSRKVIKNNIEQRKENKNKIEMKCWPGNLRTKNRHNPLIVNIQNEIATKRYSKRPQILHIPEQNKPQRLKTNQDKTKNLDQQTSNETSKSCCIDFSDIYPKRLPQRAECRKNEPHEEILRTDKTVINDRDKKIQVYNQGTQLKINTAEDYKEITLNQIKTILQSVLEEVKTTTKLTNSDNIVKKHAVVQKGSSQNSMPGNSTLLHSYTYNNSCNTNSCLPSCSKQIPHGQHCIANVPCQPIKYLQNFPVFIQPMSGRQVPLCACYYRKSSYKSQQTRAATTSTNTEKDIGISSSKETEKLIKEIYKSMALNMDFPTKDSSTTECNDLQSGIRSTNVMESKNTETSSKCNKVEAMVSPIHSMMKQNQFDSVIVNTQSDDMKHANKLFFNKALSTGNINTDKSIHRLELHHIQSSDTIVEDEESIDEFNDDSDSDETVIVEQELKQPRKPKKGFFNRMLQSVKIFKKNKQTPGETNKIETSDSDDYETYSEKSARTSGKAKSHAVERELKPDVRVKRSPYLEQEYRRHWNEELTFNDRDSKCSSERPVAKHSTPPRPVYWNNYEARSAIVENNLPNQRKQVNKSEYQQVNNNCNKPGWLKRHKFGINCGEQWKRFILEN